ncbi:MAG: acetyl ornithine aminotransferase family protein [Thermoplasmata archaeon]|nr:acetyl ornithine aminotransferase family protein [Thermoplasmata archaeon]
MKGPEIRVTPPGPKAREIIAGDDRYLILSTKTSPVVATRGEGIYIEDVDGNTYLDFTSGIGVTNTGHCHPRVVKAVHEQVDRLWHFAGTDFYYEAQVALAKRLVELTPGDFEKMVFFTSSGTEAIEAAIKLCKWYTNVSHVIGFIGAFHGRTMGSLALTASKPVQKDRFFPWMPGAVHVPYPNVYRPFGELEPHQLTGTIIDLIERHLDGYLGDNVAGIFVEPIQGEGGYIIPPRDFLPALRKLATEREIPLVCDEVQSGFGRTGKMFAVEHFGVAPDLMTWAKGMGSGIPIGAVSADAKMDFGVQGAHSNTYGGNLIACAASLATIDVIIEEDLCANATRQGAVLMKRLSELQGEIPEIGDVRGLGLMIAAEFVKDRETKEHARDLRNAIVEESYRRGLVLLPCGRSAIRFIPPLIVTEAQVNEGMDVFSDAVFAVMKRKPKNRTLQGWREPKPVGPKFDDLTQFDRS